MYLFLICGFGGTKKLPFKLGIFAKSIKATLPDEVFPLVVNLQ
jgi:hypothetical protein